MKKKIIICIAVVVALVLMIPIPMRLKDGGSVVYQAVLYSVKDVHSLNQMVPSLLIMTVERSIISEWRISGIR